MKYFTLKNRTIPQIILLAIGIIGALFTLNEIIQKGVQESEAGLGFILFVLCIWSATAPPRKATTKETQKVYDDILDSNVEQ